MSTDADITAQIQAEAEAEAALRAVQVQAVLDRLVAAGAGGVFHIVGGVGLDLTAASRFADLLEAAGP